MKKFNIISLLVALFFAANMNAQQVTLATPDMAVEPGATFHMDLQVADFQEILSMQFSMKWDAAVIEFVGVDNFGLDYITLGENFNLQKVADGELRFLWDDDDLSGETLANDEQIFSIWFKAVGGANSTTQVLVTDTPMIIEVSNLAGQILAVNVVTGTITIGAPLAAGETHTSDFTLFQNSPNPFMSVTNIRFNLTESGNASLSIFDANGKVVFEKNEVLNAGEHTIPVSRDKFQSAGIYFYALKTDSANAMRQLIVQ